MRSMRSASAVAEAGLPGAGTFSRSSSRVRGTWRRTACEYPNVPEDQSQQPPGAPGAQHRRMRPDVRSAGSAVTRRDPLWAAQLVVLVAILLDVSLPSKVTIGPAWLLPSVEGLLLLGLVVAAPDPTIIRSPVRRRVAIGMVGLVSVVNSVSLGLLVHYLLHHGENNGRRLILAGIVLWITNVLLFGLWYWLLDRGGPAVRYSDPDAEADFLFPQMTEPKLAPPGWLPNLVDYLYVSFTNATAFSPTDTMPLTANAKLLMAGQSLVSLVTIGLVVARAVNILQ